MNMNKIKKAMKIGDNTEGVNLYLFGIPTLFALLFAKLFTIIPELEPFAGIGFIGVFIFVFVPVLIFISTMKYFGIKPTLGKLLLLLLFNTIAGLIVTLLLGENPSILLTIAVGIGVAGAVFKYVFKTDFERAYKIVIVSELLQLAVVLVFALIIGASIASIAMLGSII